MSKKIVVAGAGHGAIATASILAKEGFDVSVYELKSRDKMGYDWTDIFDRKGLSKCGIPLPSDDKYKFKKNMTFFNPSCSKAITQHVPEDQLEIQMERKDIYELLISHAEECGVKFFFESKVTMPVLFGNRVVGIIVNGNIVYGDLIIDGCGIDSPVRNNLPAYLSIQNSPVEYEQFYVYRGFFNKSGVVNGEKFRVNLLFDNKLQVCWVADDDDYTDVLIGRFEPFTMDEVNDVLFKLRSKYLDLGTELIRGGTFVKIPVRQPLAVLVADGYAAIGDSAFMTVPVIGSGIANSLKAARILADAVISDVYGQFSASTLWKYQRDFYKRLGNGLAPLACIKLLLTKLSPEELDYIFENNILNSDDMTIGADSNSLYSFAEGMFKLNSLKAKIPGVIKDKNLLKKVLELGKDIAAVTAVTASIPLKYDLQSVSSWSESYNSCFKR